jgi:hypothetical protein
MVLRLLFEFFDEWAINVCYGFVASAVMKVSFLLCSNKCPAFVKERKPELVIGPCGGR